jgi:hypothetical protein
VPGLKDQYGFRVNVTDLPGAAKDGDFTLVAMSHSNR